MSDYLEQHRIMHEKGSRYWNGQTGKWEYSKCFTGKTLLIYADLLERAISLRGPSTLLDYGCGKGRQYAKGGVHETWDYNGIPTLYDPCYAPFSKKPSGTYDGVICTDVLEHVPENYLSRVIQDIFDYAVDFVFIGVSVKPAKKNLPNGNNAHSTVRPIEWWGPEIDKYNLRNIKVYLNYEDPENPRSVKSF